MNSHNRRYGQVLAAIAMSGVALLLLTGCATTRIDWNSRIGTYTYDQAVIEFGPPDKAAKLTDNSTVAEWLTSRGYTYVHSPWGYGYYPWHYGPWYPYQFNTYTAPDAFLRLVFDPEGRLKGWRSFYR